MMTPLTPSMAICPVIAEPIETLPITPPETADAIDDWSRKPDSRIIKKALHVLSTERLALTHLEELYAHSSSAQSSLSAAVFQILQTQAQHGKVVFTGIGKSKIIAQKLVATFLSLSIHSVFLHPTDALHGDLGLIRPNDTILMITFSGRTPELVNLLHHIPNYIPLIVMSSHQSPETCPLLNNPQRSMSNSHLLPAPIHESETISFGLSAPTSSTTVALALGDSLALAVADKMHDAEGKPSAQVFASNHPGGAIGAAHFTQKQSSSISDIAISVNDVPIAEPQPGQPLRGLDVLLAAARSSSGFVRTSSHHMIGPRRVQKLREPGIVIANHVDQWGQVVIERSDWISILGTCTVDECKEWIIQMREEGDGRGKQFLKRGTILGIVDQHNEVSGVVEIETILGSDFEF